MGKFKEYIPIFSIYFKFLEESFGFYSHVPYVLDL